MEDTVTTSSEKVIDTATAHAEAVEESRASHISAMLNSPELANTLEEAVVRALGRGASEGRYVDVGRIPFICDDIRSIKVTLDRMNSNLSTYPIVKIIVFGLAGAVLLAVLGEILYSIGLGHSAYIS